MPGSFPTMPSPSEDFHSFFEAVSHACDARDKGAELDGAAVKPPDVVQERLRHFLLLSPAIVRHLSIVADERSTLQYHSTLRLYADRSQH
jgi:hypothetical protein